MHALLPENHTVLDIAEKAIKENNKEALLDAVIAARVMVEKCAFLIRPLMVMAKHLANDPKYLDDAVIAFSDAAKHAFGVNNEDEKTAAELFSKYAYTIPNPSKRLATFFHCGVKARTDSNLQILSIRGYSNVVGSTPTEDLIKYGLTTLCKDAKNLAVHGSKTVEEIKMPHVPAEKVAKPFVQKYDIDV